MEDTAIDYESKYNQLLAELKELDQGVHMCGDHLNGRPYKEVSAEMKKLPPYGFGWNAAVENFHAKVSAIEERLKSPLDGHLEELIGWDIGFFHDGKYCLLVSDTFAWGCADAEEVPPECLKEVCNLYRRYGWCGVVYWVSKRRNWERSEFRDVNRFIEFVRREEELCEREPSGSKRAYTDYSYTLGENSAPHEAHKEGS